MHHCDQTAFSVAPDKRPENISDSEDVISGQQRTHSGRQKQRNLISAEILLLQTASSLGGGFPYVRTLKANGALPEAFRGLSENHFGLIVADADRSLRSSEEGLSEGSA